MNTEEKLNTHKAKLEGEKSKVRINCKTCNILEVFYILNLYFSLLE